MLISVILPVYNMEGFISECINSVLNQKRIDLQLIIVDDGSTDNSFTICKEYAKKDNRILLFKQENQGPGVARNKALNYAKGDYISFIDSDDFIEPDYLYNMCSAINELNVDIVQSNYIIFDEESKHTIQKNNTVNVLHGKEKILELYFKKKYIDNYLWNKVFKTKVVKNVKFKELFYSEDQCFLMESIHNSVSFGCTPIKGYYHRVHKGSLCQQKFNTRKLDVFKAIDIMREFCVQNGYTFDSFFSIDACTYASRFYAYTKNLNDQSYKKEFIEIFKKNYPLYKELPLKTTSIQKRLLLLLFNVSPTIASKVINLLGI